MPTLCFDSTAIVVLHRSFSVDNRELQRAVNQGVKK